MVPFSPGSSDYRVERVSTSERKFSKIGLDRQGNVLRHEESSSRVNQALADHTEYARYLQKKQKFKNYKNRRNRVS